jgi:hypothetical protein
MKRERKGDGKKKISFFVAEYVHETVVGTLKERLLTTIEDVNLFFGSYRRRTWKSGCLTSLAFLLLMWIIRNRNLLLYLSPCLHHSLPRHNKDGVYCLLV